MSPDADGTIDRSLIFPLNELPKPIGHLRFFLLCIPTLGFYALYRFYMAGNVYESLSGKRSSFRAMFWIYLLALWIYAIVIHIVAATIRNPLADRFPALVTIGIGALVVFVLGLFLLAEILDNRDQGVRQTWGTLRGLTNRNVLIGMWAIGTILSYFHIAGSLILLVQIVLFFDGYNRITRTLLAAPDASPYFVDRSPSASRDPSTQAPPPATE